MDHICCAELPETATHLAEAAAIEIGHDYWLDDETHWIWEMALQKYEEFYDWHFNPEV